MNGVDFIEFNYEIFNVLKAIAVFSPNCFTAQKAAKQYILRQALTYMVREGFLEKIYFGAYHFFEYEPKVEFYWENGAAIFKRSS